VPPLSDKKPAINLSPVIISVTVNNVQNPIIVMMYHRH
jgi:hypothetical protein